MKTVEELRNLFGGIWGSHPEYLVEDWRYWDWVWHQIADDLFLCGICRRSCNKTTAHLHQGQYIGDECCWEERLKSSE
jgi:hypothetical protein